MPLSWWYDRGWEDYFTVVEWDQRGAGKTYLINDPRAVAPTMTRERFVEDAEEMTAWLRKDLGKPKIFVWGHSWGSYLGLELARRHPDWLYAYIGTGQVTNSPESERRGYVLACDDYIAGFRVVAAPVRATGGAVVGGLRRDHLLMAAATLMTLPVIVLFFACQRYFVRGAVMSGIKG